MIIKNLLKPQRLKQGDTIGIISPAGAVKEDNLWQPTIDYFEKMGFSVKIAAHARDKKAYLAGEDQNRLSDLMNFFEDDEIKAIICSRGGYGTYRILSDINYEKIKNNPKIFVGYSDITALLLAFLEKSNIITFHGPLALSDFGTNNISKYTEENFFNILQGKLNLPYSYSNISDYECIKPGEAEGCLIGGNLAIISGLLGTPYFPDMTNKILFLEDIGEPLYKIDRMLMQLKLAGIFDKILGLLFCEFSSIAQSDNPIDIIKEFTKDMNIPVGYGFPAGHGHNKATLPLGIKYYFNSSQFKLILEEEFLI
ncbi:MAG: LD-carboxypeptidase [bacterium]